MAPALTTSLHSSLGVEDLPSWLPHPPRVVDLPPVGVENLSTPHPQAKLISNRRWDGAGAHWPHYPGSPEIQVGAIRFPPPEILELGVRDSPGLKTWNGMWVGAAIFFQVPGEREEAQLQRQEITSVEASRNEVPLDSQEVKKNNFSF